MSESFRYLDWVSFVVLFLCWVGNRTTEDTETEQQVT